ncbi:MAG: peptidoglycan-binding domain-containing protein [Actinobacteria bacterium]|nr:peptidoglycan-binding domain-containing protein [Actinomycetota bacterium]MCZ6567486.1 peptidoglycan-binding domain-containing protein [Actinomycetota bacterium]
MSRPVSERPTLKLGSEGSILEELQRRLLDEGFDPGPVDGIFGPKTKAAVVSYQDSFGLEPDGVCGPITWRAVLS